VSKKNKGQATKCRQKKLARRRAGQPLRLAIYKLRAKKLTRQLKNGGNIPNITDDEYIFWLAHGANFLVSNEEDGLWEPIFDGIYEEGRIPDEETVAQTVMGRYAEEFDSDEEFTGIPHTVMGWALSEKSSVRIYKYEAERRLREHDPECDATELARQPYNPVVWELMTEIKLRSLKAIPKHDEDNET